MSKWHLLFFTLLGSCVTAFALAEFGHWDPVERPIWTRESIQDLRSGLINEARRERQASNIERLIMELEEVLDIADAAMEISLSMSMSMSDGGSTPTSSVTLLPHPTLIPKPSVPVPPSPTTSPPISKPSGTVSPIPTPSSTAPIAPAPIIENSMAPTPQSDSTLPSSARPSASPSFAPSGRSAVPSISLETPEPTLVDNNSTGVPTPGLLAFECGENGGVELASVDDDDLVIIFLLVGYQAESTSNSTSDYVDELEQVLLETAVLAALDGCNGNVRARRQALETDEVARQARRHLVVETVPVGPCDASLNETESCTILETEILFYLKGSVDADKAAYVSYAAIEHHMAEDKYIGIVPTVLLLTYLSPLPLVPPPLDPDNETDTDDTDESQPIIRSNTAVGRLSVSPWTIGACVATIMGGIISLLVYSRNRQARRRRRGHYDLYHPATPVIEGTPRNGVAI